MNNGIPILGKQQEPEATTASKSPFFGAAMKTLAANLAKTGSTGQIVIGLFPDGSFTLNVQGQYPLPAALSGGAALGQFLAGQASQMIATQDMQLRAQQAAAGAVPLGRA